MEDEDLIEEIDDEIEEDMIEPSSFDHNEELKTRLREHSKKDPLRPINKESSNKDSDLKNRKSPEQNPLNNGKTPKKNPFNKGRKSPNKNDSSLANKLKRKPTNFNNRFNNKAVGEDKNNDETNHIDEHHNDEISSPVDLAIAISRKIKLIKIGLFIAIGSFIVLFFLSLISYIANIFGISNIFSNLGSTTDLSPDLPYYQEATTYHKRLNEASEMYANSCSIYLDRSYLHGVLSYIDVASQEEGSDKKAFYKKMSDNVFEVAKLMVDNCVVDYEIGGNFYNNLLNSQFLRNYYKEQLKYMDPETLVERIFEYTEAGIYLASLNSGYISSDLKVTMGTCEQPYNKKLLNQGTKYSSTVSFSDYLMGVMYGENRSAIKRGNEEYLKAFVIVASSYALSRSGYTEGMDEIWVHNGNCWQLSCDINEGCHYNKVGGNYGTAFTGPSSSGNYFGGSGAINSEQRAILEGVLDEVLGMVMLTSSGKIYRAAHLASCSQNCFGQTNALEDAKNGMNYKELLEKYYDVDFTIGQLLEDAYATDVSYGDGGYNGNVVYYSQTQYKDRFCGRSDATISGAGCGVTSMAMILSTFVDRSYTPPVVMNEAYSGRYCGVGISGTSASFFKYSASRHNLGYQRVEKTGNKQVVLDALKSGNSLVIAHMGPGTFTKGGHYIVLSKVNENGEVYVLDSNNNRRTGWHDFNSVVVKELKGSFHIITKR